MKNINKIFVFLLAALVITGCASKDLKSSYDKMNVGTSKGQINGYSLSIRLFGLYDNKKINQFFRVDNYLGKDFKVLDSSNSGVTYYLVDGKKYKSTLTSAMLPNVQIDDKVINYPTKNNVIYEEIKEDIPFINTNLYLTSLTSAEKIGKKGEEKIGDFSYTTYEYSVKKVNMLKILKGSALEKIKFDDDVPSKVWLDKDGYVYKIEYDLAKAIKSSTTLSLNVYYNAVNMANAIIIDSKQLKNEKK